MPLVQPDPMLLERNLALLARRSPQAAQAIRATKASDSIRLEIARDTGLTGTSQVGGQPHRLASMHGPLLEAQRWAEGVDLKESATLAVRGFGVGHHVAALARRLGTHGAIVVFEPDVQLLRSVLSAIDVAPILRSSPLVLVTDPSDAGALASSVEGLEAVLSAGVRIIDHPPSRARLGAQADAFAQLVASVVQGVRTAVVTTLAQTQVTMRNLLGNLEYYTARDGIEPLRDCQRGKPAIVVAAGPSLRRNIDLLADAGVREQFVIIAAQTVLKPLLARGIKPHFVTALDYHEISARFYEGLTPSDVEGVTLVIEPKCNPAIPRAFPGVVRCAADPILDRVLGEGLARPMGELASGATVAHLSYYLARFLGCDPVVLVGQDLAFTDGTYYAPGAAIHQVWACELSDWTSLELLEWQRIVRMRAHLRRVTDVHGNAAYTDEQMGTYLLQFERDFLRDKERGLHTIDATEGGALKQHTTSMTLRECLASCVRGPLHPWPTGSMHARASSPVLERLSELARHAGEIERLCKSTGEDLAQMLQHHGNEVLVNHLIERVQSRAKHAVANPAHWLVQHLNQTGQFRRYKADRAIGVEGSALDERVRQRRQIERDIDNVTWLASSARALDAMLAQARGVLEGTPPQTRDAAPTDLDAAELTGADGVRRRVLGTVWCDPDQSALGRGCPWKDARLPGGTRLAATLARLASSTQLDALALCCGADDEHHVRDALREAQRLGSPLLNAAQIVVVDRERFRDHLRGVKAARLWARSCWRSGLGGVSWFDEACCAGVLAPVLAQFGAHACVPMTDACVMIDPGLVDALVARYREAPKRYKLVFSQAPPGLGSCVVDADLLGQLAGARSPQASLGHVLAYFPTTPQPDPISKPFCVQVPPVVRDTLLRCVWDDANFRDAIERAHAAHGNPIWTYDASTLAAMLHVPGGASPPTHPEVLLLRTGGLDQHSASQVLARLATLVHAHGGQPLALTLEDDEARGPWREVADMARRIPGVAGVHLRTSYRALEIDGAAALLDAMELGLDVVSIDMPADSTQAWVRTCGRDTMQAVWQAMQEAIDARAARIRSGTASLPSTWLVPRMQRREDVLSDVEGFVDRWMLTCGAVAIDPAPSPQDAGLHGASQRIRPLPEPEIVVARRRWSHVRVEAGPWLALGAAPAAPFAGGAMLEGAI